MMSMEETLGRLSTAVKEGNVDEARSLAERGVKAGHDPLRVLEGVTGTLREIGERFGRGDMFLTELMFCAEAAKAATIVLTEEIERQRREVRYVGRALSAQSPATSTTSARASSPRCSRPRDSR